MLITTGEGPFSFGGTDRSIRPSQSPALVDTTSICETSPAGNSTFLYEVVSSCAKRQVETKSRTANNNLFFMYKLFWCFYKLISRVLRNHKLRIGVNFTLGNGEQ